MKSNNINTIVNNILFYRTKTVFIKQITLLNLQVIIEVYTLSTEYT